MINQMETIDYIICKDNDQQENIVPFNSQQTCCDEYGLETLDQMTNVKWPIDRNEMTSLETNEMEMDDKQYITHLCDSKRDLLLKSFRDHWIGVYENIISMLNQLIDTLNNLLSNLHEMNIGIICKNLLEIENKLRNRDETKLRMILNILREVGQVNLAYSLKYFHISLCITSCDLVYDRGNVENLRIYREIFMSVTEDLNLMTPYYIERCISYCSSRLAMARDILENDIMQHNYYLNL